MAEWSNVPTEDEMYLPDDEIWHVASDESNHHDWNDLRFKAEWQEGFVAGAKWARAQVVKNVKSPQNAGYNNK